MTDRARRVQTLGTHRDAVHDTPAAKHAEWIVEFRQPLRGRGIPAIGQKPVSLQQSGGPDEFVRVPPERGTARAAAGAQNAFVQAVEFFAVFRRLQALDGRRRFVVDQEWLDLFELPVELGQVDDEIANYRQSRQRPQYQLAPRSRRLGNRRDAGQSVDAVDIHAVRAANPFAAGAPVGDGRILGLGQFQHVEDHEVAAFRNVDFDVLHRRFAVLVGVVAIDAD